MHILQGLMCGVHISVSIDKLFIQFHAKTQTGTACSSYTFTGTTGMKPQNLNYETSEHNHSSCLHLILQTVSA